MKKISFLIQHAPYDGSYAQAAIDFILSASVYSCEIALVFYGDGVWQLIPGESNKEINITKNLTGLVEFGVKEFYADEASIQERNLNPTEFVLPIHILNTEKIGTLLAAQSLVLNF